MTEPITITQQLYLWTAWRTRVNNSMSKDLLRKTYHDIHVPEEQFYADILRQPGIYKYGSVTAESATSLNQSDFVNFGIPRASIDIDNFRELTTSAAFSPTFT